MALVVAACSTERVRPVENVAAPGQLVPDPLYAALFERGREWTLPCVRQWQGRRMHYEHDCEKCEPRPVLTCRVVAVGESPGARTTKVSCNGQPMTFTLKAEGLFLTSVPEPVVPRHPVDGVIHQRDDEEGWLVQGKWVGASWCVDVEAGKSNSSWHRWCVAPGKGIVGTFDTTAEAVVGERCGDPL